MQMQHIEFLRQFQTEDIALPREGRPHGSTCFRHFGLRRKERRSTEKFLEHYTSHTDVITLLISRIEREERVVHRRLWDHMIKALKIADRAGRKSPDMAAAAAGMSAELRQFMSVSALYQDKIASLLRCICRTVGTDTSAGRNGWLSSKDIRGMHLVVSRFLDVLNSSYDVFTRLLQEEYNRTAKGAASPVGAVLTKLATLLKGEIFCIESIAGGLQAWMSSTRAMEMQALCN